MASEKRPWYFGTNFFGMLTGEIYAQTALALATIGKLKAR